MGYSSDVVAGDVILASQYNNLLKDIDKFNIWNSSTPTGSIHAFSCTPSASYNLLQCDGAAVSRATYSELFSAIGITHGQGDGTTTFNVPDYRGLFLRGLDGGISRDPDRASRTAMNTGGNTGDNVGSVQLDAFQGHKHSVFSLESISGAPTVCFGETFHASTNEQSAGTANGYGTARVSTESRPKNANVKYFIKY